MATHSFFSKCSGQGRQVRSDTWKSFNKKSLVFNTCHCTCVIFTWQYLDLCMQKWKSRDHWFVISASTPSTNFLLLTCNMSFNKSLLRSPEMHMCYQRKTIEPYWTILNHKNRLDWNILKWNRVYESLLYVL